MSIYWLFFLTPLVLHVIQQQINYRQSVLYGTYGTNSERKETFLLFATFAIIIFFTGMRSEVADTYAYIGAYQSFPDISKFSVDNYPKDTLFFFLSCLFKSITGASYQPWLFCIALISGFAVGRGIYKFSEYKWLSCYLFVATALVIYMFNGMRQFIPVSILFCKIDWLLDKKYIRFILLMVVLAQIHGSAWFILLLAPVLLFKPFGKGIRITVFVGVLFGIFYDYFAPFIDSLLYDTQYAGKGTDLEIGAELSVMRLLVSAVPVVMAFVFRRKIANEKNRLIDLFVNCSVLCMLSYTVSRFTSGLLVGRLATYFNIFNIILLPWMVVKLFSRKSSLLMIALMILLYGIFFYYQMCISWGGLPYISDPLGISFY